jgi:hypothetical protein
MPFGWNASATQGKSLCDERDLERSCSSPTSGPLSSV